MVFGHFEQALRQSCCSLMNQMPSNATLKDVVHDEHSLSHTVYTVCIRPLAAITVKFDVQGPPPLGLKLDTAAVLAQMSNTRLIQA